MVQLEEVEDEAFIKEKFEEDDDDYTDTDSEISELDAEDADNAPSETLADRFFALKDMVPPAKRRRLANTWNTVSSGVKSGAWWSAQAAWVVSTSVLLLGVPFALAVAEDQQLAAMEREQDQRQMGSELMTPNQENTAP